MHGTIQTIHAARGFGFLRDPEGAEVFFHRSALTPPECFATLEVQTSSRFCLPQCGMKPTVLDWRKSSDIHARPLTH